MCEFKHGDEIEYEISGQWRKGTYVAPHPISVNCHVYIAQQGHTDERPVERIRKPKQKKEGWMNVWPRSAGARGIHIAAATLIYATKEEALSANHPNRQKEVLATVKVEWEE